MMYFDSAIHMDSWSALTLSAILVLYTITCYIYMRNFANLCIMVWNLDSHGCTWINLIYMRNFANSCIMVWNLDSHGCT
jgi:hypothetical protein